MFTSGDDLIAPLARMVVAVATPDAGPSITDRCAYLVAAMQARGLDVRVAIGSTGSGIGELNIAAGDAFDACSWDRAGIRERTSTRSNTFACIKRCRWCRSTLAPASLKACSHRCSPIVSGHSVGEMPLMPAVPVAEQRVQSGCDDRCQRTRWQAQLNCNAVANNGFGIAAGREAAFMPQLPHAQHRRFLVESPPRRKFGDGQIIAVQRYPMKTGSGRLRETATFTQGCAGKAGRHR